MLAARHDFSKTAMTSHRLSSGLSPLPGQQVSLERTSILAGEASAAEGVVAYHERTKHHFHRYAAALQTKKNRRIALMKICS